MVGFKLRGVEGHPSGGILFCCWILEGHFDVKFSSLLR
jgi:hypothetical protein